MHDERRSTLLRDVEIAGNIIFAGHLTFDGQLRDGDIAGEDLVIGPRAVIQGNIRASSLVLHGSVTGEVMVTGSCEIKGTASLVGSLVSSRLAMEDGAKLVGGVVITRDAAKQSASS